MREPILMREGYNGRSIWWIPGQSRPDLNQIDRQHEYFNRKLLNITRRKFRGTSPTANLVAQAEGIDRKEWLNTGLALETSRIDGEVLAVSKSPEADGSPVGAFEKPSDHPGAGGQCRAYWEGRIFRLR